MITETDKVTADLFNAAVSYAVNARNPGQSLQEYQERVTEAQNRLLEAAIQYAFTHGTAR